MTLLAVLGGFVSFVFLMIVNSIFNGYALSVLWGWFVVPTFNIPQLSVAAAIGIAIVVRYLTHQIPENGKGDEKSLGEQTARIAMVVIFRPSFALLVGYIVHLFM
ncbi:MAG: hypothetical protein HZA25_02320 [Candidatus Niyogibacteria bacterium]|nr:hypothetical protein [Candidatus Niyogibacteria bacterium]